MDYSYPRLERVFKHYQMGHIDVSQYKLFSCMHLLEPQLEMFKRFIAFGFKSKNITVLGKIYSSNEDILSELKALGINAIQPEFNGQNFDLVHTQNCEAIVQNINDSDKNILLDDGGYLIDAAKNNKISYAVEQTSSGFRKLEKTKLDFPVFNVARSKTKLTQESPLIARRIFERTTEYLEDVGIDSPNVVVVGLGPIGQSILQVFLAEGFQTKGFDVESSKTEIIAYLKKTKPDVVIGATGCALFNTNDIDELYSSHTFYFVSASSSDREFPVASYRSKKHNTVHEDVRHKNIVFVNNGFPITFKGLWVELTPVEIEKTIALLMGSVFAGFTLTDSKKGFISVPSDLEKLINQ